jgi:FMN phosphatase YigB (HAD superfamily)
MSTSGTGLRPPKAVIFDIGRVIVRLEPERALEPLMTGQMMNGLAGSGRSGAELWAAVQRDSRWNDWQEGRMSAPEWHEHLTRQLRIPMEFDPFCAAWNRTLHPETILSDALFARLATQCKLAVLSNTDPLHSALLDDTFSFLSSFPVRIYSCRVGASKPSPVIYQAALNALGTAAGESLYIDDIPEFVAAAQALGMDAVQFENPSQLAFELERRGLATS